LAAALALALAAAATTTSTAIFLVSLRIDKWNVYLRWCSEIVSVKITTYTH